MTRNERKKLNKGLRPDQGKVVYPEVINVEPQEKPKPKRNKKSVKVKTYGKR